MSNISNLFSAKIVGKLTNENFRNKSRMYYTIIVSSNIYNGAYDLVLNHTTDMNNLIEVSLLESKKDSFLLRTPIIQSMLKIDTLGLKKMPGKNKFIFRLLDSKESISFISEKNLNDLIIDDMLFLMIFKRLFEDKLSNLSEYKEDDSEFASNNELIEKIETLKFFINRMIEFNQMNIYPEVYQNNHFKQNDKNDIKEEMKELVYFNGSEFLFSEVEHERCKKLYLNFENIEKNRYEYDSVNVSSIKSENLSLIIKIIEMMDDESLKNDLLEFISFYSE